MAEYPAIGFKTDVRDEDKVDDILTAVAEEFDAERRPGDKIRFSPSFELLCGVLNGDYSPTYGMEADGLVFVHYDPTWPEWDTFVEYGNTVQDVASFIDEEFDDVSVDAVIPVVRHT